MVKRNRKTDAKHKIDTEILASINLEMETVVTAGVVDHDSQLSSWVPNDLAEEQLLEAALNDLDAEQPASVNDLDRVPTLAEQILALPKENVNATVVAIAREIDRRSVDENVRAADEGKDDANIQKTITKIRNQLVTKRAASLLIVTNVEPSFVNRVVHTGSAYNVYALGKLADIVYGVTNGIVANAINVACMKSLFAFKNAGVPFTMECAKGAASKQYARNVDASVRKHLISHTVSTSTAPTQASSTMQALVTLGVVSTNGAGKNPTYTVRDTPIAHKLEEMLKAA